MKSRRVSPDDFSGLFRRFGSSIALFVIFPSVHLITIPRNSSHRSRGYVPAAAFVHAYLGVGDKEQAFAWMEQAYEEQSMILQYLKVHPFFDPVRDDPRFADLLRRVGLS
jgi:hypothetical protein